MPRLSLVLLVAVVPVGAAHATMIHEQPAAAPIAGGRYVPLHRFSENPVRQVLTYRGTYYDADKDGWVDTRTEDVNPLGYVVLHFSTRWKNVRIGMGGLLGTDIVVNAPLDTGWIPPEGDAYWPAGLGGDTPVPDEPDPPRGPDVPEPASAVLLMFGASALLARRGVRARRS